jgi:hypothetical protein
MAITITRRADNYYCTTLTATTIHGETLTANAVTCTATPAFTYTMSGILTANATVTGTHDLGARPTWLTCSLVCLTGNCGYAAGDELFEWPNYYEVTGPVSYTQICAADATHVFFGIGTTGIVLLNKNTSTISAATVGRWGVRIKAGI